MAEEECDGKLIFCIDGLDWDKDAALTFDGSIFREGPQRLDISIGPGGFDSRPKAFLRERPDSPWLRRFLELHLLVNKMTEIVIISQPEHRQHAVALAANMSLIPKEGWTYSTENLFRAPNPDVAFLGAIHEKNHGQSRASTYRNLLSAYWYLTDVSTRREYHIAAMHWALLAWDLCFDKRDEPFVEPEMMESVKKLAADVLRQVEVAEGKALLPLPTRMQGGMRDDAT
ncbi:hypothetical protein E4U53_008200 [Claviceps sorghi]|nr:hypothetical protein E4U53_008200 [Claviceps sorghi]